MTTLREAAQQALKSLRGYRREIGCAQPCDAEQALVAALEQPEPEPEQKSTWQKLYEAAIDQRNEAAEELRRLHAVNQELLEALQMALSAHGLCLLLAQDAWKSYGVEAKANAAIARAEGKV